MKHPSKIIPIVGSNNPAHIKDAVKADALELSAGGVVSNSGGREAEPLP